MLRIEVNLEACLLHGQCVIAAPDLFSFDEEGALVWVSQPDESARNDAEAAADACPEQAIEIG